MEGRCILIHELVINTLILKLICFIFVAPRLLCVRVHHLSSGRRVSQAELKMLHQYFNFRYVYVEAICPEMMPPSPEEIEVINTVDPF